MDGNAGTQSSPVAVMSLATRDLTVSNLSRVERYETIVGSLNELVFVVIIGSLGLVWFGSLILGYVIATSMVIKLIFVWLAGKSIIVILECSVSIWRLVRVLLSQQQMMWQAFFSLSALMLL